MAASRRLIITPQVAQLPRVGLTLAVQPAGIAAAIALQLGKLAPGRLQQLLVFGQLDGGLALAAVEYSRHQVHLTGTAHGASARAAAPSSMVAPITPISASRLAARLTLSSMF